MGNVFEQKKVLFETIEFGWSGKLDKKLGGLGASYFNQALKPCYMKNHELLKGQHYTPQDSLDSDENPRLRK